MKTPPPHIKEKRNNGRLENHTSPTGLKMVDINLRPVIFKPFLRRLSHRRLSVSASKIPQCCSGRCRPDVRGRRGYVSACSLMSSLKDSCRNSSKLLRSNPYTEHVGAGNNPLSPGAGRPAASLLLSGVAGRGPDSRVSPEYAIDPGPDVSADHGAWY